MKREGFTLIELLIVVAIIAILAAIAVPNFLEAQTRSKVSRAKADMRTLATAIEAYCVDWRAYPWIWQNPGYDIPRSLTTPVAFITSIPTDPFGPTLRSDYFFVLGWSLPDNYYFATKKYFETWGFVWQVYPSRSIGNPALWVLQSKGPDKHFCRSVSLGGVGVMELDRPYDYEYDSTNGTISLGNIVRSGP